MSETDNGQHPFTEENATLPALTPAQPKPKRHNAKFCSLVIQERIVNALAAGDSQRAIARHLRVSPMTVRAIGDQEWAQVSARKDRIAAQAERASWCQSREFLWINYSPFAVIITFVSPSITLTSTSTLISLSIPIPTC
jgi:hypothetical protein